MALVSRTRRRTVQVPESTGFIDVQQLITEYDVEFQDLAGETYAIRAVHVDGALPNIGELHLWRGTEDLEYVDVDLDSTANRSEAGPSTRTFYTGRNALNLMRRRPHELTAADAATREAGFLTRLEALPLST